MGPDEREASRPGRAARRWARENPYSDVAAGVRPLVRVWPVRAEQPLPLPEQEAELLPPMRPPVAARREAKREA